MIEKINFGAPNSLLPEGYILDSGAAYSLERGYGWITEATLGEANPTPIDIIPNSRDRNVHRARLLDTLVAFQYRQDVFNPRAIKTNAAWEYNLPNGHYRVSVSVGDPIYDDSRHVINVEGKRLISDFTPTANNLFKEVTQFVTVEDGKLTVDGIGGFNTKLNYIEISPVNNTKINFGTSDTDTPAGYIQDSGQAFNQQIGYGWVRQDSLGNDEATPIDISPNSRDRALRGGLKPNRHTGSNVLTDSLVSFQYRRDVFNTVAVKTPAAWEYVLANGEYRVTVSVGDASYTDSNHVINIEGEQAIAGFTPTADELFKVATKVVTVADGRLTIDGIGGENTKINYVEIEPASATEETPTTININFGTSGIEPPAGYIQDFGAGYSQATGYGWVTQDSLGDNPTPIDITANTRDRDLVSNQLQDSLIAFQYPEGIFNPDAVKIPAAWEYALENGTYEVTVSVGDASYTDSNHVINIEGQQVISGFVPTANELFTTATATIEVNDGKLTIDAIGGENSKLNYVQISSVGESGVSEEVSEF